MPGKTQKAAAGRAQQHAGSKNRFLKPFKIRHRSKHRPGNRHDNRYGRDGIAPVRQVINIGNSGLLCNGIKINREQRGHKQDKRRISHIVQHPCFFYFC